MLRAHGLTLYEPRDLRGEAQSSDMADLQEIATWAVDFLGAPNEQLGRSGAVCPYTRPSIDSDCFLLAWAGGEQDVQSVESTVERYRRWFMELLDQTEEARGHLLTILVVLPGFDRMESSPLDALQSRLKDGFVRQGLMVGQFHPGCEQGGLWNEDFRPLRAPLPLLAIRRMVTSDLPFLLGSANYLTAYLQRFAPDLPSHVRRLLVARITNTDHRDPDQAPAAAGRR